MTSRMSSGSRRLASAVEPTKSTNITVSCRRSACVAVWPAADGAGADAPEPEDPASSATLSAAMALSSLLAVAEGGHAELLEVRLAQLRQDLAVDVVLAEDLLVALQA